MSARSAGGDRAGPDPLRATSQLGRFLIVGCANFALSFAVFYLLYRYLPLSELRSLTASRIGASLANLGRSLGIDSIDAAAAQVAGYSAGLANSFFWNRRWTFGTRGRTAKRLQRFLALNLACLLLSSASMLVFTDLLGWPYKTVWVVTMTVITGINFVLSRNWVFATRGARAGTGGGA